ncbi:MAG: hypothetical protein ACJ75J_17075 [Cytophagaceae bacterium]
MARKFTTANSETPKVIEPVTLSQGEKVNKALVKQIEKVCGLPNVRTAA